ncbi:pheromone-processing carboxypeptidase KEX1-like [Tripterygium wilfordii]|uniref:Pheromone-processing carboxypeptidase KEX1-like n=1 Tax=Tripterygium wilfordii TaxID=458696 RepID=A0A7J7D6M8_TRIWF|nr:pheromone-processing carboxypeptidase KEX1-like [Tripterygium wilfordii]
MSDVTFVVRLLSACRDILSGNAFYSYFRSIIFCTCDVYVVQWSIAFLSSNILLLHLKADNFLLFNDGNNNKISHSFVSVTYASFKPLINDALFLFQAGSLLDDVRLTATDERFPVDELRKVKRPDPENKDSSDTDDDEDDEDDDNVDDQDEDDAGDEDFDGEEGGAEGDPEDDPEANDGGGSSDDDDEDDDDDDGDEDDAEEDGEEDEDEDEDEEVPQPPAKKRK